MSMEAKRSDTEVHEDEDWTDVVPPSGFQDLVGHHENQKDFMARTRFQISKHTAPNDPSGTGLISTPGSYHGEPEPGTSNAERTYRDAADDTKQRMGLEPIAEETRDGIKETLQEEK